MSPTRWAAPIALLVAAIGFGTGAVVIEIVAHEPAAEDGVAALGTPVLSVRRLPGVLAAGAGADLRADLAAWSTSVPAGSCAVVAGPTGAVVLDLRGDQAVIPASSQKLLTATAALLALGPDARVGTETMRDVAGRVLRESDDAAAERLLDEVGRASHGSGATDRRVAALELLERAGLDLTGTSLADASGHSVQNRVTCRLLVDVLRLPATAPVVTPLLAVAGESGTLAERFVGTPLAGHLRAKTGSLRGVAALAGVVEDRDGSFTFAYVVNGVAGDRVDETSVIASQQRLGELLLEWSPDAGGARLGPLPLPDR